MSILRKALLGTAIILLLLFGLDRWTSSVGSSFVVSNPKQLPQADVILVPGARIYAGEVSGILAQRLDAAIEVLRAGRSRKILVSGDYSSRYYDEARAMQKYLVRRDVEADAVVLDHAGFSTYDSVWRAKNVFGIQSMIIVSQDFHLPRALFIAHELGLEAVGFSASRVPLSPEQSFRSEWREPLARMKALYDILRKAQPAFTGSGLPIDTARNVVAH